VCRNVKLCCFSAVLAGWCTENISWAKSHSETAEQNLLIISLSLFWQCKVTMQRNISDLNPVLGASWPPLWSSSQTSWLLTLAGRPDPVITQGQRGQNLILESPCAFGSEISRLKQHRSSLACALCTLRSSLESVASVVGGVCDLCCWSVSISSLKYRLFRIWTHVQQPPIKVSN
jgi:hypothetical protein